ncbi:unnamed protein product, partial [Meganyctiphanes norvegica]
MMWRLCKLWCRNNMLIGNRSTISLNTMSPGEEPGEGNVNSYHNYFRQSHTIFFMGMFAFYVLFGKANFDSKRKGAAPPVHPKFPPYVMYIPAFCDMLATSIMYLGLTLTYASSFQMLRGAVIVFTGLFSVAFLGRKLRYFNWLGIGIIIVGLLLTGIADFIVGDTGGDMNAILTGDLLIVLGQIVTATQMVVEEKFVMGHNVPALLAVGWEGLFGFITLSILLIPMYHIPAGPFGMGNPRGVLEDALDGFTQLGNSWQLCLGISGNILSIAFFNFAGVSITKELSATSRMVLDSVRTLVVWVFSLLVGWQAFIAKQFALTFVGFILLVTGMFIYNDLLILPFMRDRGWINDAVEEEEELVVDENKSERGDDAGHENKGSINDASEEQKNYL